MILLIAAAGQNNELGKDNQLLWHLPDDFKRFKQLTTGHHIILGRKTFESFPKPLPNRKHIIITRQKNYLKNSTFENCIVVNSIQDALKIVPKKEVTYIIGGADIYKQSINIADIIELTRVHGSFEADTFFPKIDINDWELTFEEFHAKDEKHLYDFTFQTFARKK